MRPPVIGLLTDFGDRDWYVGTVKAVLLDRCPNAQLVDITHAIPPQDTLAGAFTLAAAAPWFPPRSVLLAVVDPGVGTTRAVLAARADARWLVGPDNGLLSPTLAQARRVSLVRVTNPALRLSPVSRTFQARDIMAPAAAALASGRTLRSLGPSAREAARLVWPTPSRRGRVIGGCVLHVDRFGNLITNVPSSALAAGRAVVRVQLRRRRARFVTSYAAGKPGELIALVGSLGLLELAVRDGSAAAGCRAGRGDPVSVRVG